MRQIIAICGRPGTGKTTLMREFISLLPDLEKKSPAKLVEVLYSKSQNLYIIGKYEDGEVFAGTDKLSMAAAPEVLKWIQSLDGSETVIFEGDRLTSRNFYESILEIECKFDIFALSVKEETLTGRYAERGSNQNETFLQGRATKISNILSDFELREYITEFKNETVSDQQTILSKMKELSIQF